MRRTTNPRVRFMDSASRVVITIGGIAVIIAVLVIMLYLLSNVLPLFGKGRIESVSRGKVELGGEVATVTGDEYRGMLLVLLKDGRAQGVLLDSFVAQQPRAFVGEGLKMSAWSEVNETGQIAIGTEDGSVQIGQLSFERDTAKMFLRPDEVTDEMKKLGVGDRLAVEGGGYVELTPRGQFRKSSAIAELGAAVKVAAGSGAIRRLDIRSGAANQFLVVMRDDGTLVFNRVRITTPLGGGKPRTRLESQVVKHEAPAGKSVVPGWVFVTGDGSNILCVWEDGTVKRYAMVGGEFVAAEVLNVVDAGVWVTSARMHLGSRTLLLGTSNGEVLAGFVAQSNAFSTPDGWSFVVAHRTSVGKGVGQGAGGGKVVALSNAGRDRSLLGVRESGELVVYHTTSEKRIVEMGVGELGQGGGQGGGGFVPRVAMIAPKGDGIVVLGGGGEIVNIGYEAPHPEASLKSLFGRVWYEGDAGPGHTYQASSGEDTAEAKYGQVPLIFGTIKGTVYAMLFAVPIAILAAIYTSEFLHPRVRNVVKPVIEMMASLPSVVLGFLCALVIAPVARDYLPGLLMAFFVVPMSILACGYLWQMLPVAVMTRLSSLQHVVLCGLIVVCGVGLSIGVGRVVQTVAFGPSDNDVLALAGSVEVVPREQWPEGLRDKRVIQGSDVRPYRDLGLYYKDNQVVRAVGSVNDPAIAAVIARDNLDGAEIRQWLDGIKGGALPGWVLILTGPMLIVTVLLRGRLVDPLIAGVPSLRVGTGAAVAELVKFVVTIVVGVGLAVAVGRIFVGMGLDVRDSVLGSYSQRNTLVVGIVMGFAIIPIIYTISEDALSSVPGQLRSASLGCGATRWQTATRVVLPIALSGIFSACMIGLGRAAGETMIVLMATGNTPSMDWNVFGGFRTLAANIAVEMPEAAKDSTHYRVLFLGALCLFALTFAVNTLAEIIRQRVRRRNAAL